MTILGEIGQFAKKFNIFGNILRVHSTNVQMIEPNLGNIFAIWQIFNVANIEQIIKAIWSHWTQLLHGFNALGVGS